MSRGGSHLFSSVLNTPPDNPFFVRLDRILQQTNKKEAQGFNPRLLSSS